MILLTATSIRLALLAATKDICKAKPDRCLVCLTARKHPSEGIVKTFSKNMGLALLYPLGYMIYGSFRAWDPSQNISETDFVGLKNYITLFFDPAFRESLTVTLTFAFAVVTAELAIGVGLALMLDRNIRGMSMLRTLFILPMMIAPVVVGLMWRYMYHPTVGTINRSLKSMGFEVVDWLGQHALL